MPLGYLRARILYDQQQNPVDLLFTDANLAAKKKSPENQTSTVFGPAR